MIPTARRRLLALAALLTAMGATVLLLGLGSRPAEAFPFPSPTYQIVATSGGHTASLLNLPLGQPGLPQVPMPVDVDGDLLPDVLVSVNLIEIGGVFNNPPNPASILQPNVQIDRLLTTPILGQSSPPLRIEAKLRLIDLGGSGPDTNIRFGYDTGPGGSIPPTFKATLGGLPELFNPLSATVDTGPSAGRPVSYDGPLRIVGNIQTGGTSVDLGFGFSPFPHRLALTYLDDEAGQHLTYAHSSPGEVDLRAEIDMVDPDSELHLDAKIERLPGEIAVDIAEGGSDAGAITWASDSDGRRPDIDVHIESSSTDGDPMFADIDLESLPQDISAAWSLPEGGPTDVVFDAGGQGIGGVDIDIRNHQPDAPGALPRFVPTEQQFLSVHQAAGPDGEKLSRISGRVERVRHIEFSDTGDVGRGVLDAQVSMGDGELPLQVSYDCRFECSEDGSLRLADVDATVSPLPGDFGVTITEAGEDPRDEPMVIDYVASEPVDVDGSIRLAQDGSTGTPVDCGSTRTVCADVLVRDVPASLHTTLGQYVSPHGPDEVPDEADLRLAVDLGEGSIAPDLEATVVLGPEKAGDDPLVADATALALPQHTRVYLHQHKETTEEGDELVLDRAAFHACDRGVDDPACEPETEGEIGSVSLSLRSFEERPDGFPVPLHDRAQYATVTSRPDGLEVGARIAHVRDLEYLNTGPLQGVFASAGDGATPFTARIDIEDSPLTEPYEVGDDGDVLENATRDLRAEAVVTNLPPSFGVCFRTPNVPLVAAGAPFTTDCEESELDGDPLAFAYGLDVGPADTVSVDGTFATTVAGTLNGDEYSETLEGEASVPDVPSSVIVQASLPEEDVVGPIDAIYDADATLDIDFAARTSVNGSRCLDPRPEAEAMCVEAYLDEIPSDARIHYDPTITDENLRVTASTSGMSLQNIVLSTVRPREEPIEEPFETPEAMIVTGFVEDLPASVRGTIVVPQDDGDNNRATQLASTVIVCASTDPCDQDGATGGQIGHIDIDARNVAVADPTPLGGTGEVPEPRDTGLGTITDEILVFQRGHAFHASLDIEGVGAAGYRQVADDDRQKLATDEMLLRFGEGVAPVIRAYADLDLGTARTIADVVLSGVPASTRFCFRGEVDEAEAADPTWCDLNGDTDGDGAIDSGALQLRTIAGADTTGLDVDAFVRQTAGGDANGMSGRVRITDLPSVLQGTVPIEDAGSLEIAGLTSPTGSPDGIGVLRFEAATFDIEDHGFDTVPWFRTIGPRNLEDFPAPELGTPADPNHMSVAVTSDGFHARGQLNGLQRIGLRDGLCEAPTASEGPNPIQYPGYPEPTGGAKPYTCARLDVDDTIPGSAAGEPFAVRAFARDGHDVVLLENAGLTAMPKSLQFTLAEGEALEDNGGFRPACRPLPFVDPGCLPPMVRVDIDGAPSQLFGELSIGTEDHLEELAEVAPRDGGIDAGLTWADLDAIPTEGARVRIGTWADEPLYPDVDPGFAAIAKVRLPLPASLQIDAPQTWSDAQPSVDDPDWEATDIRMHYVAREADGDVIESLGDLKVLVHNAPANSQILLSGGDELGGAPIPGEMAMAVYLRDDKIAKRMFVQADGHVSTDMSISALILPPQPMTLPGGLRIPSSAPDRIALQVLNIPGAEDGDTWDGWHDPGFRLQAEVIDDSEPPDPCSDTSCSESSSRLAEVRALLDFHPEGSDTDAARLVQAVVHTLRDGPMGVQLAGYTNPTGGGTTAGGWADGDAEISVHASLRLDPMHSYEFSGVPWLANWTVALDASIELAINVDRARNFRLFNETLGIVTDIDSENQDHEAYLGPINMIPDYIYAGVTFLGVTLFGFELSPFNAGLPLPFEFPSCDGGDVAAGIIFGDVFGGSAVRNFLDTLPWNLENGGHDYGFGVPLGTHDDTLVFPALKPPGFPGGGLDTLGAGVLADLLPGVAHGIGCGIFDATAIDLITDQHPAPPIGAFAAQHLVPGEEDGTDHDPPEMDLPPDAGDNVIFGDDADEAEMCGLHAHNEITVVGTVKVAANPGPNCDAADVGYLELAGTTVTVEGTIDADAVVEMDCAGTSEAGFSNYDFERDGATHPLVAYVAGTGMFDPVAACNQYKAAGTGAGHGGSGGSGGVEFGRAYDTRPDIGLATAGIAGGNGTTATGGGEGGGHVRLTAAEVVVNGTVSADGEHAADAGADCTVPAEFMGGGGGSGGGITLLANRITFGGGALLSADGGDGGDGAFFGGGAGAVGDIEVRAGIVSPAPPVSITLGSPGQQLGGCGGFDGTIGLPAYYGHTEEGQQSAALPLGPGPSGDIWHTSNDVDFDRDGDVDPDETTVTVPFMASAGDPNSPHTGTSDNGMTVALCGVALSPDTVVAERLFRLLTPDYVSPSDPCGLADIGGIARINTARLIDHVYLPDEYHISAFDGFSLDIEDLTANPDWCPSFLPQAVQDAVCGVEPVSAYYGLYTVVLRSDTPGNDCLEFPDINGLIEDITSCWDPSPLPSNDSNNDCRDPSDFPIPAGFSAFGFEGQNVAYDNANCFYPNVEVPPGDAGPDVIIGLDNDAPTVEAVSPTWESEAAQNDTARGIAWTNEHVFAGSLTTEDRLGDTDVTGISGVRFFECWEDTPDTPAHGVPCTPDGTFTANLSSGDGRKDLFFRVFDAVGNSSDYHYDDVVVDTSIPTSTLAADPDPGPLPNGWYFDAPTLTLSGFPDPDVADPANLESGPDPDGRYRYQIDEGTEFPCQVGPGPGDETCVIPDPIGPGGHRVWFTAVDRAGNRGVRAEDPDDDVCEAPPDEGVMGCRFFGRDFEAPLVGALGAPDAADGANNWWVTNPFVGITTFDLPVGGSGVDPTVSPSVLEVRRQQQGAPPADFVDYEGPEELADGIWTIQARARDVAGNPNSTPPENPPTNPLPVMVERQFRIDATPPALALSAAGPAGSGGWFTGPTTVSALTSDAGSGINPIVTPSGVFVSVDDGPFVQSGPVVVDEGEHVVRAYAVDVAGNRSDVVERVVNVDRSRPVSAARTTPPAPAQNGWFRTAPTITLKATDGDENAGVSSIRWCLGTACTPSTVYTQPFAVPAGTTVVRWRALDVSGAANHEPIRSMTIKADTAPPTAKANLPAPIIWSQLLAQLGLGPSGITLKWTVGDDRSGPLRVQLVVFDIFGTAVRRLDAGVVNVPPGTTVNGQTTWDGKNNTLSGLVPVGVYHYRVVVTDEAGNVAESGESRLITIKLL